VGVRCGEVERENRGVRRENLAVKSEVEELKADFNASIKLAAGEMSRPEARAHAQKIMSSMGAELLRLGARRELEPDQQAKTADDGLDIPDYLRRTPRTADGGAA